MLSQLMEELFCQYRKPGKEANVFIWWKVVSLQSVYPNQFEVTVEMIILLLLLEIKHYLQNLPPQQIEELVAKARICEQGVDTERRSICHMLHMPVKVAVSKMQEGQSEKAFPYTETASFYKAKTRSPIWTIIERNPKDPNKTQGKTVCWKQGCHGIQESWEIKQVMSPGKINQVDDVATLHEKGRS
ncbi:hypothetical protein PR048_028954 [Dryococelus australis]|uniref:Uncharacterized protein n=1 Tax=Dryococelus australis TaxID=614101 RepID=A0ABQ9GCE9_9NEOP|nr:hypothetical protein PR048_028954 [Dryococelus australis]